MVEKFDFDRRVLMCGNCGAPLETGFAGGTVRCEYCGTSNLFLPRKEEPVEPLAAAVEMDEDTRMEMLRRQDGRQPEIPQELKPLISGGELAPWKVKEALSLWSSTCRELSTGSDYSDAELLYYLTIILSNHYSGKEDDLRERALYESALEVLTLPRHRQIMRGFLARNAALEGDTEAARKWLAPCNPRSEDLETDSSYRVSMAEILTVEEDWEGVLKLLGQDFDKVPITSALDGKAIVQRANALERSGRTEEAIRQLNLFMEVNGSLGRKALRSIVSVYTDSGLQICPESLPGAEEKYHISRGNAASSMQNPGCFGQSFAITGVFMIALGLFLGPILGSTGAGTPLGAKIMLFVMGCIFLAIGARQMRAGRKASRLVTRGVEGIGTVQGMQPTGWTINDVPQYLLELKVELPGSASFAARAKMTIPDSEKERYSPGAQVTVMADPEDTSNITVMD
jgi:DNA-directed RNA polymerase subunit RPC12/RpoP